MAEKRKVLESEAEVGQFTAHAREILFPDESGCKEVQIWLTTADEAWNAAFGMPEGAIIGLDVDEARALRDFLATLDLD